jgi:hypothetical protein
VAECPAKTISLGRFEDRNIFAKLKAYGAEKSRAPSMAPAKGVE